MGGMQMNDRETVRGEKGKERSGKGVIKL